MGVDKAVNELLKTYSLQEIIMFLVMFAIAFKAIASFWDWLQEWLRKKFGKKENPVQEIENKVTELFSIQQRQDGEMGEMHSAIDILLESDKDNIKSWIVEKHHHFCYEVGAIDYFSLESIERRYEHYRREDGNSYVATLMEELKALPKIETSNVMQTKLKYEATMQNNQQK